MQILTHISLNKTRLKKSTLDKITLDTGINWRFVNIEQANKGNFKDLQRWAFSHRLKSHENISIDFQKTYTELKRQQMYDHFDKQNFR